MAVKKKSSRRKILKQRPVPRNCVYCKEKRLPDYKNYEELARYQSDRGKIYPKTRTGLCTKHQKKVALEIKRARHLGLLPFTLGLQ